MYMHPIEPTRWDDLALAVLLLLIGLPRALLAFIYDKPIEAEGALSLGCVMVALFILLRRNTWARPTKPRPS